MKIRLLIITLILTPLAGYLEWSKTSHAFIGETEILLLTKLFTHPFEVLHPFTISPLLGQLILLVTLFQKNPQSWMVYTGMICMGVLMLFLLIIGLLSLNYKIALSALPFMASAVITAIHLARLNRP